MARGLIVGFFIVQIVALLSLVAGKGIINKVPLPRDDQCVLQSSDKTLCVEWKYPLPTACSAFVQCSANCLATTRWCPKLAGVWQYFSDASQSCVSPDTLNCADIPPPVSRATETPAPTPAVTMPPSATVSTPLPLLHVASDQYRAIADTTFSVTRSADLPSAVDVIDFDSTAFDGQTAFDLTTDTFTPVTSGLYWLHWTVGMPHFTVPTNVTLHGLPTRISSLYRDPAHYGDTNSRTELVELEAGNRLTLSSTDTLRSNPTGVEISFSGFHLQSTMNPVVAFHGAMTGTTSGSLTWDTVVVDTHGGFVVNYYYTIPVGGIWYVTLRCSDNPSLSSFSSTHLFIAETYRAEDHYYINHWHSDGIDTYSMSVIMNIPTGYNLGAVNIQGSIYGDADHPTAMLGFLYSPIDTAQAVAWYVAISNDMIGPLDPLPFGNILQNVGSAWQVDRHVFVAPHPGLYYITLSAMKKDSAEAEMELLLNEAKHATLYFPNTGYPPTRSRDIILRLIAGDELKIRLPALNGLLHCGSGFVCTTFGGFRLSA